MRERIRPLAWSFTACMLCISRIGLAQEHRGGKGAFLWGLDPTAQSSRAMPNLL